MYNYKVIKGTHPMATRGLIGKQLSDGSILAVYCHYDNYPAYNGRMLRDNFDTAEKVNKLIDGGDMSCTWTNAGWNNETLPESGPLYYTMRGESMESVAPQLYKDLNEFLCAADDNYGAEYTYHYVNGEWICHKLNAGPDRHMVKQEEIPAGPVA
jgi:hypothetical protein